MPRRLGDSAPKTTYQMDGRYQFECEPMPDQCPPEDAVETSLTAFHFCREVPPGPSDFEPLTRRPHRPFDSAEHECQASGISVFVDRADALALRALVPKFRKWVLSVVFIGPTDGRVKHTSGVGRSPSHHTFWPYQGSDFRARVRSDDVGTS